MDIKQIPCTQMSDQEERVLHMNEKFERFNVIITLKNVLFTTIYGSRILKLQNTAFIKPLMSSMLVFTFILTHLSVAGMLSAPIF